MNAKLLVSLISIATVAAVAGGATVAYFSDTESSTENTFAAGTLNLGLANTNGTDPVGSITKTWTTTDWAPNQTKDATLYVNNEGSIDATKTNVSFDYAMTEGTPSTIDAGTTKLEDMVKATTVNWGGVTVSALQGKTLKELKNLGLTNLGGLTKNTETGLQIVWTLDSASDNGVQGDKVDVTVNVALEQ